jgi:hypothetical protein
MSMIVWRSLGLTAAPSVISGEPARDAGPAKGAGPASRAGSAQPAGGPT